jgi:adenylate cyclase
MNPATTQRAIPEDYDQYFLQIMRVCLRYGYPIGPLMFLGFFLWDCLFTTSFDVRLQTLSIRLAVAVVGIVFWLLVPRIRSLNMVMALVTALYLVALLALVAILMLVPGGLIVGVPGLLLVAMFGSGLSCLRPMAAVMAGSIGIIALSAASFSAGLPYSQIASNTLFFASSVLFSGTFLFLLDREFRQKHIIELSLEQEKRQSETLLKEILPRYVIQRIRDGALVIADSVSEVDVIFIDIVGFTAISRKLAPAHLLEILSELFGTFDANCAKYQVTKIKTIGDAYMAATTPGEDASSHAHFGAVAAVEFCIEAIRSAKLLGHRLGIPVNVRVGIATGAVISGVLSLKRPAYDLWGETVNLASRMESSSEPGTIHISETTYWRVRDKFKCETCGPIEVKGIGTLQTYVIREPLLEADQLPSRAAASRLSASRDF